MISRNLKYYSWVYENGQITLICRRQGNENQMTLSMPMADSFIRAYISFTNHYRIEQVLKIRTLFKRSLEKQGQALRLKIERLEVEKNKEKNQLAIKIKGKNDK